MKFLLITLVFFVPGSNADVQQARQAASKATEYLESQRDVVTGVWPLGERAAASLGLLAKSPYRHQNLSSSAQGLQRLQLETLGISTEFLHGIRDIQKTHGTRVNPLTYIDDTALLEFMASLRGLCIDQRDYFGYNLVRECVRRFQSPETIMYGGMALALCNARRDFSGEQIRKLANIRRCPTCPFHVEEGSMNLLAAICIADNYKDGSTKDRIAKEEVIPKLVSAIMERQNSADGDFGGFMATALAVQSLNRVDSNLVQDQVTSRGLTRLLDFQRPDGSFGESIGFTSLAIPALTGQTVADLRTVTCPNRNSRHHIVSFIVSDSVYSKQKVRGHIRVENGTLLIRAFQRYSRRNPHTFKLTLVRVNGKPLIKSLNGLTRNELNRWFVLKIHSDGRKEDVTRDWSDIRVDENSTYEIKLSSSSTSL